MTSKRREDPQPVQLSTELRKVVDYFRDEFDMDYATAIGAVESLKLDLYMESREVRDAAP